jgi:hypothetical protein
LCKPHVTSSLFLCRPKPPFCHPEASAEGSLGTCVPREDKVGNVAPSHPFFVAPRRQPRCPSALACLGMTSQSAIPNEVRRDAVPSEVRDASLSLGMTKNGRSAGQGREGTFLNNPNKNFPSYTWIAIINSATASEEGAEKVFKSFERA